MNGAIKHRSGTTRPSIKPYQRTAADDAEWRAEIDRLEDLADFNRPAPPLWRKAHR